LAGKLRIEPTGVDEKMMEHKAVNMDIPPMKGTLLGEVIGKQLMENLLAYGYNKKECVQIICHHLFPGQDSPKSGQEVVERLSEAVDSGPFSVEFLEFIADIIPDGHKLVQNILTLEIETNAPTP
jgi:hypothetical protein